MHGVNSSDGSNVIDWGKTSVDYAAWRPDYPDEFYSRLAERGIGLPDQRILDLGTGVGFLARRFARNGAKVVGIDVSSGQIEQARRLAVADKLNMEFLVRPAEETGLADADFDAVTASQCWLYFDKSRAIPEVKRLLRPGGVLLTCHFCWLPREDPIARASEALVLRHNPGWTAADWTGEVPRFPEWAAGQFELADLLVFDAPISFTREQWRGRMRACRGVGASLPVGKVAAFDREHAELLERISEPSFAILHRIDAHILRPV
jgi:SAM-dependent methyltransferase